MDKRQFIASIKAHKEVSPDYFLISIDLPPEVKKPRPGEFFMVKAGRDNDLLLRRPLSLHRIISADTFQVLYRVKGRGTGILSRRMQGEKLDILGPLGRGFEIPSNIDEAILVAGGIGIAPLFSLAEELRKKEKTVKLFLGGKSRKDILCEGDFGALGIELFISTEDGSHGRRGLVTELLADYLTTHDSRLTTYIYTCGPKPMLKRVSELARIHALPCYVSLEERMACGVGACLGCAIKIKVQSSKLKVKSFKEKHSKLLTCNPQLYKMVCKDGPVFNAEEIHWDG